MLRAFVIALNIIEKYISDILNLSDYGNKSSVKKLSHKELFYDLNNKYSNKIN